MNIWEKDGYVYTFDKPEEEGWEKVDIVVKELRAGYMLDGKVIRPAQVVTRPAYRISRDKVEIEEQPDEAHTA